MKVALIIVGILVLLLVFGGMKAASVNNELVTLNESINGSWAQVDVALQRDASVVFTSSLADGQNLVPFQAAIAQSLRPPEERAVIVAGRDAGVCQTFQGFEADGLVPVDPLDADSMTFALTEALEGRPGRISDRLIDEVRRHDAQAWATGFLADLEAPC